MILNYFRKFTESLLLCTYIFGTFVSYLKETIDRRDLFPLPNNT